MKPLLIVIFSWFVFICQAQIDSIAFASSSKDTTVLFQPKKADTKKPNTSKSQDTVKVKLQPFNFAFLVDYGKIFTYPTPLGEKWELGTSVELWERIEIVGEYGKWEKNFEQAISTGTYNMIGTYWRLGAGMLLPFNNISSRIGLGFRYGQSQFRDEGTYKIEATTLTEAAAFQFGPREGSKGKWISGVLSTFSELKLRPKIPDSPLNKIIKVGATIRYKVMLSYDRYEDEAFPTYAVPGFGRTFSDHVLTINLFLRIYPRGF